MIDMTGIANLKYTPSLYDVNTLLDQKIVGEHESRMALFTNWILAHQCVNMNGASASGKTYVSTHVSSLLPIKGGMYILQGGSNKSFWFQEKDINEHSHLLITELNKLPKTFLELLKDMGEGRKAEHKITEFQDKTTRTHTIQPRPFVFCLADEEEVNLDEQLRTRLTTIRTNAGKLQNEAVLERQANEAMLPPTSKKVKVSREAIEAMRFHIQTMPSETSEKNYIHPAAMIVMKAIPSAYTSARRDFPKYRMNTYGITRFHWKNRMKYEDKWLVTPEDMWLNHIIYGDALIQSAMQINAIQRSIVTCLRGSDFASTATQIQNKLRDEGTVLTTRMVAQHLGRLADLGYINAHTSQATSTTYELNPQFADFEYELDWKKVIQSCIDTVTKHYPIISQEYIDRFCVNPVTLHPFTGLKVTIGKEKSERVKEQKKEQVADEVFKPTDIDEEVV